MGFGLGLKLGLGKGGGRPVNIQFLHNGFTAPDTLTTGALYVADNLGVLRTAGVDKVAIPGARLDGSDFVLTDTEGAQIFTSASVRTKSQGSVTQYTDADWQGMLVMPADTNESLKSRNIGVAPYWDKGTGCTITLNDAAAPSGSVTATKVVLGEIYNPGGSEFWQNLGSVNAGTGHASAMWFKGTAGQKVYLCTTNGVAFASRPEAYQKEITFTGSWQRESIGVTASSTEVFYLSVGNGGFGANPNLPAVTFWVSDSFHVMGRLFVTADIPTDTAAVARAATVASFTSANYLRANDMGGRVHVLPSAAGQTGWLFNSYTGAAAEFGLLANPTTLVLRNRNASVDTDLTLSYTHVADREFQVDWLKLATGMHMRVREKIAGTWQAWSAWSDLTTTGAQADATIAATYQYARNGANQFAASRPNFYTMFDATKAKLESLQ